MAEIKKIIKSIIPPVATSLYRNVRPKKINTSMAEVWSGDYASWAEAFARCTGYDNANILEKCKNSLLKVKNGETVYERDSVVFDEMQYSWGLLAGLQRAALENDGKLCVLDFGGSLGSTYYQNKNFLNGLQELKWHIVEQNIFVNCGKKNFETNDLKFYYTINDCINEAKPDVLILSSVLQYLENPYDWIREFVSLKIPYIILDRTSIIDNNRNILTIQKVPEHIYKASYPCWFFDEGRLLKHFKNYTSVAAFESYCDLPSIINLKFNVRWMGQILKAD